MREYMTALGSVLIITAFAKMLVPEGSIKKYVSLATGFMIISTALSILPGKLGDISFSEDSFSFNDEEITKIEAQYKAEVIKEHRKNLSEKIEAQMKHGSKAFAEVSPDGQIISVTLVLKGDESKALQYIVEELGVERERIKIKYDKD